jgi:hypothetical protein
MGVPAGEGAYKHDNARKPKRPGLLAAYVTAYVGPGREIR